MADVLEAAAAYLDLVFSHLRWRLGAESELRAAPARVQPVPTAPRYWFEELETTDAWNRLVQACAVSLSVEGHSKSPSGWRRALQHWFRRTGTYLALLKGDRLDPRGVMERLVADTGVATESVTFLALLEGVRFSTDFIELCDFAIVRPTRDDLEKLLGLEANSLFYPHAITSLDRLTNHWYIRTRITRNRRKIGRIYFHDPFADPVRPEYTAFDASVEAALKRVVLWEWTPDHFDDPADKFTGQEPWRGFSIPFVITASDDPFHRPPPAPPIGALYYEPVFDNGEEIGERPGWWFDFDPAKTSSFQTLVRRADGQIREVLGVG